MASREELERALAQGCTVQVAGHVEPFTRASQLPKQGPSGTQVSGVVTRDPQGRLTRNGMELVIAQGGSVFHQGEAVDSLDLLPTEADLARGDETRVKEERARLLAHRATLDAELAKLAAPPAPATAAPQQQAPAPQAQQHAAPQAPQAAQQAHRQDEDEGRQRKGK